MIYLLEDDQNIRDFTIYAVQSAGMEIRGFALPSAFRSAVAEAVPDVVLLDIMLPEENGLSVLRWLRETPATKKLPIMMISARSTEFDKVLGLELGADDYVVKPFDAKEVLARVKAVLRRTSGGSNREIKEVSYENLTINLTNYELRVRGQKVDTPPKELELVYFLASSPNHVYTREQLLNQVWGYDYAGDSRTVDVHIKRLREKIKDHRSWKLSTIWGVGYKFEVL